MQFCSIASGSSGNCIYTGSDNSHILIDAGISGKRIENGLNQIGLKAQDLRAICVTHEHNDHIAGLGVMSRRYGIDIYATKGTIEAIKSCDTVGKIDESLFHTIKADNEFVVDDLRVMPLSISHDAAEPVSFIVRNKEKSVAVVTDLGEYNEYLLASLQDIDLLMIEANHDIRMLQAGRYPYQLKKRILSNKGHLSNESSGRFLSELLHDNLKAVFLGHLSKENNYEKLAYETVRLEVAMGENEYSGNEFPIYVAKRDSISQEIFI